MRSLLLSFSLNNLGSPKLPSMLAFYLFTQRGQIQRTHVLGFIAASPHSCGFDVLVPNLLPGSEFPGYHGDKVPLKYMRNQSVYWGIGFSLLSSEQTKAVFLEAMRIRRHLTFML